MAKKTKTTDKPSKKGIFTQTKHRVESLRARRPHKSFQLTRRRDIPKHPALPGYFSFTASVIGLIKNHAKLFGALLLLYLVSSALLIGVMQLQQYQSLKELLNELDPAIVGSQWETLSRGVGMFTTAITGGLNSSLGEIQQLYLSLLYLVAWLVVIWLLRQVLAGNTVRIRDALYNACAPFISTLIVLLLMVIQALPAAIGLILVSTTSAMGIEGVAAMMFALVAILLVILSLYWLTSSIFALLIVTLPGTYPMAAIRSAGDLAVGRRLSLMLRLLWLAGWLLLMWVVILIPIIIFDNWLNIAWSPLVPIIVQILSGISLFFATTYVYLLYRRMIDEPGK